MLHQEGLLPQQHHDRMKHLVPDTRRQRHVYFCDVGESIIHGHPKDWVDHDNRVVYYHCPTTNTLARLTENSRSRENTQYFVTPSAPSNDPAESPIGTSHLGLDKRIAYRPRDGRFGGDGCCG